MNSVVHYLNILGVVASMGIAAEPAPAPARDWAAIVGQRFRAERDVVYKNVAGTALKLDFYIPYDGKPGPTLLYIHGGGWQTGSKEQYVLWYLPYLAQGWRVAAVQYRLSGAAPAPAAIEDCRCAFRWVAQNGAKYGVDPKRIAITGGSAGGHLALMTAFSGTEFDRDCPEGEAPRAIGVINYYGATDVEALRREGRPYLDKWLRGASDPSELARRISPLTWIKAGLPPVLTLHGDADKQIPYEQGVRLHKSLDAAGVRNQLVTIPGGGHGRHTWSDADTIRVQRAIERFLESLGKE